MDSDLQNTTIDKELINLTEKYFQLKSEDSLKTKLSSKYDFNKRHFVIVILTLFSLSSLFSYYIVDKRLYTKDDKFSYKKFMKVSLYLTIANMIYLLAFYFILSQYNIL